MQRVVSAKHSVHSNTRIATMFWSSNPLLVSIPSNYVLGARDGSMYRVNEATPIACIGLQLIVSVYMNTAYTTTSGLP